MNKVENNQDWYLMCPDECPGLTDVYGDDYIRLYNKYVDENKYKKKVKAREIWNKILESQIETGVPYIAYKDNVNQKSNQKNVGVIKSSNLCIEIMEYSDENEYAVCNLASIAVNKFVKNVYDFNVLVYTKTNCSYCKKAKKILNEKDMEYTEVCIDSDEERHAFYQNLEMM